jgi:multidrug efflux pump subunit AcrA (membrane-fusion protein)
MHLPNPDYALRPGTFGEITIALREIPRALVVPPQAVISGPKGKSIFAIKDGIARSLPVQTGITDGNWIEITEGLHGTEDVVVVGKRRLTEGTVVHASPYTLPHGKPSVQKFERRSPGNPSTQPELSDLKEGTKHGSH